MKLKGNLFWHKLRNWEYWPFNLLYFPVFFYFTYLAVKARSFFFFASSNPTIDFGGMLGESKSDIFDLIPEHYIPVTRRFSPDATISEIDQFLKEKQVDYPFIAKPDIGERGWMVVKINNQKELATYLEEIKVDFLIQAYVDFAVELGVFYHRHPSQEYGVVSSIVMKEMLHVMGDGKSTLKKLVVDSPRALMHIETLEKDPEIDLEYIPKSHEKVLLGAIGNHCKGTTFLNANNHINPKLTRAIDQIAKEIKGFYFGRFDLRCSSFTDLEEGLNFKIMELNGAGSEPGHIYQPGYSLIQGYKDIFYHLRQLYEISLENKKLGIVFPSFAEGIKKILEIRRYNKAK